MDNRQEVEIIRIISAFGVVWFHISTTEKDIAYAGLIAFLIISMYFAARPDSRPKNIQDRAKRIIFPWLFWFLLYGVVNIYRGKPFIDVEHGFISGVLSGTGIHLWYLPFIFMVIVVFDQIKDRIGYKQIACIFWLCALFMFLTVDFWRPWSSTLDLPYGQYTHALAGVSIGIFFGSACSTLNTRTVWYMTLAVVAAAAFTLPAPGVGVPYILATTATAFTLLPRWHWSPRLKVNWLSECALGIYLSHPLLFLIIYKLGITSEIILPFLVFASSAIFIIIMKCVAPKSSKYIV